MINNIVKENRCCGCSACFNICPKSAITMLENSNGFLTPKINNELCIYCNVCDKVCPANIKSSHSYMKCYTLRIADNTELSKSQSGGAFYAVAKYILKNAGVVYGVSNQDIKNVKVVRVDNLADLEQLLKSKYVQSDFSGSFKPVATDLQNGLTVFYGGTACAVQGLINYLNAKKISTEKLLTCDLICHGVPSRLIVKDHINYIERKYNSKVISHLYRDKSFGWGKHKETYELENKAKISNNNMAILLSKGYSVSPTCFKCEFTTPKRISDMTIGDYWQLSRLGMSKAQFSNGLSVVLVRNKIIENIICDLTENEVLETSEITFEDAMQWNLERPTVKPKRYDVFWKKYSKNRFKNIMPVYYALTLKERIRRIAKNILRTILKRKV